MANMDMKKTMRRREFMTSSKKTMEQVVVVDARKLSQGLKATFEGVAMVFDSLGVEADIGVNAVPEKKAAKAKSTKNGKVAEERADEPAIENETVVEANDEAENTGDDAAGDTGTSDTADVSSVGSDDSEVDETQEEETTSTISPDDVTKIIVQKIKQDRSNNEKIGQILKTYGAAKVGELDPKKYEAFLTDVAAL